MKQLSVLVAEVKAKIPEEGMLLEFGVACKPHSTNQQNMLFGKVLQRQLLNCARLFDDTEGTAFMSCSKPFLWVSGQQAANKTSTEPCSRNDPR